MYKLVAIDLDGTLLNSYGSVSQKNKETIKKAIEKGTQIVIASGRPLSSARSFANEIGANHYMICGNGSALYDIQKEQILYNKFIERNKVLQIIKICEENSIFYSLYTENLIISKALNYNILFFNNENKKTPDDRKTNIKIIDDIYKYVQDNPNIGILKITICDESCDWRERKKNNKWVYQLQIYLYMYDEAYLWKNTQGRIFCESGYRRHLNIDWNFDGINPGACD